MGYKQPVNKCKYFVNLEHKKKIALTQAPKQQTNKTVRAIGTTMRHRCADKRKSSWEDIEALKKLFEPG